MKKAGQEIICYCTQCKLDLNHVILAMKGVIIAKVQCLTCHGEHQYRPKKADSEGKKSKKKTPAREDADLRQSAASISQEWQRLMDLHRSNPAQGYSLKKTFVIGDRIQHPQFGEGVVQKVIYPNKVDVIFQDTLKTLIHGRAESPSS